MRQTTDLAVMDTDVVRARSVPFCFRLQRFGGLS